MDTADKQQHRGNTMSSLITARRLALLAGAALSVHAGSALAQDQTTNVTGNQASVTADAGDGDIHTVNILGRIGESPSSFASFDLLVLDGDGGGGVVVNNDGRIGGRVDFGPMDDGVEFNIGEGGAWHFSGISAFGGGRDELRVDLGGLVVTGGATGNGNGVEVPTTLLFGDGDSEDIFRNAGVLIVAPRTEVNITYMDPESRRRHQGELRLQGLETFENSGVILLGGYFNERTDLGTEVWHDDILSMPGTNYIGDNGKIVFDVNFNALRQDGCDASLRDSDGYLPAADCVALHDGSTDGVTRVAVNAVFADDRGAYAPEGYVLIDVSGGTSAAGHFILDPDSTGYTSSNGGLIDRGVFAYALVYDEDNQQHRLVGAPSAAATQFPLLAQAAHSLWRVSTGSWFERQADLRGRNDNHAGGVWLRLNGEAADRDARQSVAAGTSTLTFDNAFGQNSYAITGGADLVVGSLADSAYVLGVSAGYANSEVEFESFQNTAQFDGFTVGAYASLISGPLFVDASFNVNKLILKQDIPALDLQPAGTLLDTDLISVGGQVEAGLRLPVGDAGVFFEPLASVSYVRTQIDDVSIPSGDAQRIGVTVTYDDPTSLRGAIGGRIGADQSYGGVRAQYSLLARVWNEFDGEASGRIGNIGPDLMVTNTLDGQFTELSIGGSLHSAGGAVSGFVNIGGKFGDDYGSQNLSAGVRVNW